VGTALEPGEELDGIARPLPAGAEDAREDLRGAGAARGAVAAADLAGHDRGADGVFGLPVGGLDVGATPTGEERGALGPQMLAAAVRRMGDAAGEQAVGANTYSMEKIQSRAALRHARGAKRRRKL
jgi:hypothetical protein